MHELLLIAQILSYAPPIDQMIHKPLPAATGTGTLLVAACQPTEAVVVMPGTIQGFSDATGIVRIDVPAQNIEETSYRITTLNGESRVNGTVGTGETVSAVCP